MYATEPEVSDRPAKAGKKPPLRRGGTMYDGPSLDELERQWKEKDFREANRREHESMKRDGLDKWYEDLHKRVADRNK